MDRSPRSTGADRLLNLPRSVWLLGWVSLATDAATEAVYPLLPFFLTTVLGAGAVSLGIVEGAADAVSSLLKLWSGRAADRRPTKRPLVLAGYSISSLVRPLIALAQSWTHVFAVRLVDRVGKGVRSAPRDAILASLATPATRGKVFGFHRAMDHAGAVVGPTLATVFLWFYPGSYRTLFALTIIPGLVAVALIFFVREDTDSSPEPTRAPAVSPGVDGSAGAGFSQTGSEGTHPATGLPRELTAFFIVLTLFTLGNSTDAFLLLKLTEAAGSTKYIPLMWAGLHVVKATVSVLAGGLSDRIGRRAVIGTGWIVYAAVYLGFASADALAPLVAWFVVYGVYFGFAEGAEKALVADLAPALRRGYAYGIYNAVVGIGALLASVLFGVLWTEFGAHVAFGTGAALSLVATLLLFAVVRR